MRTVYMCTRTYNTYAEFLVYARARTVRYAIRFGWFPYARYGYLQYKAWIPAAGE